MSYLNKFFTKHYHKVALTIIFLLLVLLPFNAILQVILNYKLNITGLGLAKEALLIFLFFGNFIYNLIKKNWSSFKIIAPTLAFLTWTIASLAFADGQIPERLVYGLKYDGFYLVIFIIGVTFPKEIYEARAKILKFAFMSGFFAVLISLIIHFVITPENLTKIGYRDDWSTFYTNQSLAFCQKIENTETCRLQGFFSGPNQAGSNILLYFVLLLTINFKNNKLKLIFGGILLFALILTFSRSAWLALIAILILSLFKNSQINKKIILSSVAAAVAGIGFLIWMFPETVVRMGSNSDRVTLWIDSFKYWLNQPLTGFGLAESGPASRQLNQELITENWFLQILINFGLIGLILYLYNYFKIVQRLFKKRQTLFWAILFVALIIPLNLLHYFEDSGFSYTLFLLSGIILNSNSDTTD